MDNIYKNPELFGLVKLQKINYALRQEKRLYHIRAFWIDEGTNEIFTAKEAGNLEDQKPFDGYNRRNLRKIVNQDMELMSYKLEIQLLSERNSVDFPELALDRLLDVWEKFKPEIGSWFFVKTL